MFGIISYITQLVNSLGPGVIMCESCKTVSLYFISGKTHLFFSTRPSSPIASQPIESSKLTLYSFFFNRLIYVG